MQSNNTNNIINENDIKANQEAKLVNQKWLDENAIGYLNTIKEFLKNNQVDKSLSEKYLKFIEKCDTLSTKIGDLSKLDNEGKEAKITLEQKDELLTYYQSVAEVIDDIKKDVKETKDNILLDNVNNIGNVISKDIRSFIKMTEPQTISEVVQNGRKRVIEITGQEVNKVGANLSSRQIIKDGNEKKIFTQDYVPRDNALIDKVFEKYKEKYPEYVDLFEAFHKQSCIERFKYTGNVDEYGNGDLKYEMSFNKFKNILTKEAEDYEKDFIDEAIDTSDVIDLEEQFKNDPVFCGVIHFMFQEIQSAKTQINYMENIKCGDDEPIAERNSGMSVVAELLGIGNVICHSESVIIKDGEKEISGTMMNFANGVDINNFSKDDPIAKYSDKEILITKEAKKQIADLQILDYICGNLDRHAGNLFYKYDTTDPKQPKLIGIEGIDNDASFYNNPDINSIKGANKMVGLSGLTIIDGQTANKIKSMSPSMLKIALKGLKIDETAIDLTIERFTDLQEALNKSKEIISDKDITYKNPSTKMSDVQIGIIKDEETWDSFDIYKMNKGNVPEKPKKGKKKDSEKKEQVKNMTLFNRIYDYADGLDNLRYFDGLRDKLLISKVNLDRAININKPNVEAKRIRVDKGTKLFRGSSDQYRDVQKALKKVKAAQKKLENSNDQEYYDKYLLEMENLKSKTDIYLEKKRRQGQTKTFGTYTQNRIDTIKALHDDVEKLINDFKADHDAFTKGNNDLIERREKIHRYETEAKNLGIKNQMELQAEKQAAFIKKHNSKDVQKKLENEPKIINVSNDKKMDSMKTEAVKNKEKGKKDKEKAYTK